MNKDQIFGLLRTLGVALMTYLVSSGVLTSEQASVLTHAATDAGPIAVAIGLAAYGWWKKRDAAKVLQAGKVDGATVIVDPNNATKAVVNAALAAPDSEVKVVGTRT